MTSDVTHHCCCVCVRVLVLLQNHPTILLQHSYSKVPCFIDLLFCDIVHIFRHVSVIFVARVWYISTISQIRKGSEKTKPCSSVQMVILFGSWFHRSIRVTREQLPLLDIVAKTQAVTNEWLLNCLNSSPSSAVYMRQWIGSALVQIMACRLFGAKPLSKPMLDYCQLDP